MNPLRILLACTLFGTTLTVAGPALARSAQETRRAAPARPVAAAQHGQASIYAQHFRGRRMADGARFDPRAHTVASRTLPLGSAAKVTNLRNGRSMTVRVTDRGPHIRRRILDVSPAVAQELGMGTTGTAMVAVVPVSFVTRAQAAPARPARPARRR